MTAEPGALFDAPTMAGQGALFGGATMTADELAELCASEHDKAGEPGWPYYRCQVCYRRRGTCWDGHAYRAPGTDRPRGETRFPAGALVQLIGGPKWCAGSLGIVVDVESATMRGVSLARYGAPGQDVRVGIRGLRLFVGSDERN